MIARSKMKTMTLKVIVTDEEYATIKALAKAGWNNPGGYMNLGYEGIVYRFYEDEIDQDEQTKADAKIFIKEYDRLMKKLNKK